MIRELIADKELIVDKKTESLIDKINYSVIGGSISHGTSLDSSDIDITAVCTPNKEMMFPEYPKVVFGLDHFTPFKSTKLECISASRGKKIEIKIFSIIEFCRLLMEGNPNAINDLSSNFILECDAIGDMLRSSVLVAFNKNCIKKHIGYSYSQYKKSCNTEYAIAKRGKQLSHAFRLLFNLNSIILNGNIDLSADSSFLKEVKSISSDTEYMELTSKYFETLRKTKELSENSDLPAKGDINKLKSIINAAVTNK